MDFGPTTANERPNRSNGTLAACERRLVSYIAMNLLRTGRPIARQIAVVTLIIGCVTISDVHAAALSLREAVRYALDSNPEIRAAEANRRAVEAELRQAWSRRLPQVDLDADIGGEKIDRPRGFAANVNDVWRTRRQVALSVRQVIFDGWEISNSIYRSKARVDGAALRQLSRSEVLVLGAIEAFIDVHRQRLVLRVARRNVSRHRRYLRRVRAKRAGGRTGIGEVQQVRERLTAAQSAVLRIRQSLADAISKFNRIVGKRPGHLLRPSPPKSLPRTQHSAVRLGIGNNPAIGAAEADIQAARFATAASRGSYFPKVSTELRGAYGHDLAGTPGRNKELSGKVVLNWNLFSGGRRRARIDELAERTAQAIAIRDAKIREVTEQIERAFTASRIGRLSVQTARQRAATAARVVRTYDEEFKLAKRGLLDLLDSENARFSADIQLINVRSLYLFATYRILGATGTLLEHFGAKTWNATVTRHYR